MKKGNIAHHTSSSHLPLCLMVLIDAFLLFNIKGINNGCPCIVEIRGMQGCALVGDPAQAVGEYRDVAKAQP